MPIDIKIPNTQSKINGLYPPNRIRNRFRFGVSGHQKAPEITFNVPIFPITCSIDVACPPLKSIRAQAPGTSLFGGVGSNPTAAIFFFITIPSTIDHPRPPETTDEPMPFHRRYGPIALYKEFLNYFHIGKNVGKGMYRLRSARLIQGNHLDEEVTGMLASSTRRFPHFSLWDRIPELRLSCQAIVITEASSRPVPAQPPCQDLPDLCGK
ncbi:unnamed protein product [Phyllotreta striolata]|uniref:Uncharacterized protein n=1 Tax=Phyllotreta striolata TaxID=444603 RepID=A0A9N9TJF8_PHYSR|nr:unnamed protein product [Phyllotreta striolata]